MNLSTKFAQEDEMIDARLHFKGNPADKVVLLKYLLEIIKVRILSENSAY